MKAEESKQRVELLVLLLLESPIKNLKAVACLQSRVSKHKHKHNDTTANNIILIEQDSTMREPSAIVTHFLWAARTAGRGGVAGPPKSEQRQDGLRRRGRERKEREGERGREVRWAGRPA